MDPKGITDPEAIDAAIQLAGTIQWFEGGIEGVPLYGVIISTFESCFNSSHWDRLGLTDRAYYSMRAILQIHVFTEWQPRGFDYGLMGSYLPYIDRDTGTPGGDLAAVLELYECLLGYDIQALYRHGLSPIGSPAHLQWASNLLLRISWARRTSDSFIDSFDFDCGTWDKFPPATVANWLLMWLIFMGEHFDTNILKIEDKSCVMFHNFPPTIYTPSFLVVSWTRFHQV